MTTTHSLNLKQEVTEVPKRLLSCILEREVDGRIMRARIVETEAYHQRDAASHSYKGETPRTNVMFGPAGFAYVYFTYGMHHCFNIVTGEKGEGSAVLIRAVEPIEGVEYMQKNRPVSLSLLTNGPAKLCQALVIDRNFNKHDLSKKPLRILAQPTVPMSQIVSTTRIGISRDTHRLWRFYLRDNPFVSRY